MIMAQAPTSTSAKRISAKKPHNQAYVPWYSVVTNEPRLLDEEFYQDCLDEPASLTKSELSSLVGYSTLN